MEEMKLLQEHECKAMQNQDRIFIEQRWQKGKPRWFFIVDIGKLISNEIIYCPYCGVKLSEETEKEK